MTITLQMPSETEVWQARHTAPVPKHSVRRWVLHTAALCLPRRVYWCDGGARERLLLRAQAAIERFPAASEDRPQSSLGPGGLRRRFRECMQGRTMYVVPFVVPANASAPERLGVQLTDSAVVALAMELAFPTGDFAWSRITPSRAFLRCLHSVGSGHAAGRRVWHFPDEQTVWAYGPQYGPDALRPALGAIR